MLNMCIPIPPCLPPDPIRSPETLTSASCSDSILLPTHPFGSEQEEEKSEVKQDSDSGSLQKAIEELEAVEFRGGGEELPKEESNGGVEKAMEQHDPAGDGEKVLEEQDPAGDGEKVLDEQKPAVDEEKVLEEHDPAVGGENVLDGQEPTVEEENVMEDQEPAGDGEKVMEEQEPAVEEENVVEEQDPAGDGDKVMEEQEPAVDEENLMEGQEPACYGEKILQGRDHEIVGETGHKFQGAESEASPSSPPIGSRDLINYSASSSRLSPYYGPFRYSDYNSDFSSKLPSDLDDDCSDTRLHMHYFQPHPSPLPPPVGAGLANMGNTCFLNAVMQCFTHTVPLVHGLQSQYDSGVPRHHDEGEFCVLSAVSDHVFQALNAPGEVVFPEILVNNLSYISSFFRRFQQEDAHEFLQCLIDRSDTCWSKCRDNIHGFSPQGDSLVKRVFGGRLVSQLHCCNCGSRSDTYEAMVDLSLEIEDADDLNGALKSFTKMEENEDEVKFTCEKCKEKVPLKKQLLIDQAPSVATFHLKRFKGDGDYVEKIDKFLEYPLELNLKPYTVGSEDENVDLKYELYAFIVHKGYSSTSGHYLCYIRSSPDMWFRIDDSKITRVREDDALSQKGYILFYARKGTPWPCSLFKLSSDIHMSESSPTSVLDNAKYLNPQKASLCSPNAVENSTVIQMEADQLPYQQAFTEACCIAPKRNNIETDSPKYNEAEIIRSRDAQVPMPIDEELVVDEHSRHVTADNSTKFSNKQDTTGSKENAYNSQNYKSRSLSPDVYSESEDRPEVSHPRPLKKHKGVRSPPARKGNSRKLSLDERKLKEAQRSLRGLPLSRRHSLLSLINRRRSC